MNDHVYWIFDFAVKEGELDSCKAVMSEIVEHTKSNEPGTVHFEWALSEDGGRGHIFERYADSEAAIEHLKTFGSKFAERFMAMSEPKKLVVYGNPNEEAKKMLSGLGAIFMGHVDGFMR